MPTSLARTGPWERRSVVRAHFDVMGGMEKTTVYLTSAQKHALARASEVSGRSQAELIREGIEAVTARFRVAEPTIPLFDSGQPDLAERVDEYLQGFGEGLDIPRIQPNGMADGR